MRRWLQGASVLALLLSLAGQTCARTVAAVTEGLAPRATQAPAQATAPATPPAAPVQAHGRWLAPLRGLAAGLGLVALAGRLGLGPTLAPLLMLLALGILACGLTLAIVARRARSASGPAARYAEIWHGIGGPSYAPRPSTVRMEVRPTGPIAVRSDADAGVRRPFGVPPGFDTAAFLENARRSFVRLQSAWDRADLNELGECATDEMFNALTHELRVRAGPNRTDVVELAASLLGIETVAGEHRASVRFSGALKVNDEDERLDEVWNLSKPIDGSSGWLLAGIQQLN